MGVAKEGLWGLEPAPRNDFSKHINEEKNPSTHHNVSTPHYPFLAILMNVDSRQCIINVTSFLFLVNESSSISD